MGSSIGLPLLLTFAIAGSQVATDPFAWDIEFVFSPSAGEPILPYRQIVICSDEPAYTMARLKALIASELSEHDFELIDGRDAIADMSEMTLAYIGSTQLNDAATQCLEKFPTLTGLFEESAARSDVTLTWQELCGRTCPPTVDPNAVAVRGTIQGTGRDFGGEPKYVKNYVGLCFMQRDECEDGVLMGGLFQLHPVYPPPPDALQWKPN